MKAYDRKARDKKAHTMTDNDIVKSLEICANDGDCMECKINPHRGNFGYCTSLAIKAALDLINRQKAEVERLEDGCSNCPVVQIKSEIICNLHEQIECWQRGYNDLRRELKEAKAEAIKDFAERLKESCTYETTDNVNMPCVKVLYFADDMIDELVKELTEAAP